MPSDRRLIEFDRQMRHEPSPTERIAWRLLRHRKLAGFRFRRQHLIRPYIADFYCAVARLVIEFDGESHLEQVQADAVRESFLNSQGYRVLRFWNHQLFEEEEAVVEVIYRACVEGAAWNPKMQAKATRLEQSGAKSQSSVGR